MLAAAPIACAGHAPADKTIAAAPPASSTASAAAPLGSIAAAPAPARAPASVTPAAAPTAALPVATPPLAMSAKVALKRDPLWAACHRNLKGLGKDPAKDVSAIASACAKATQMKAVGRTVTGTQNDSGNPESYPFKAEAHHCYRVYAEGVAAIQDLELVIKDSTGAIAAIAKDHAGAPARPVVADDGAVCFKEDDAASVVVSVGMGGGAYAFQIWGD